MAVYEEVRLSDMEFKEEEQMYFYKCPCGDLFEISLEELHDGEDIAPCPSCSLKIRVLFDEADLPAMRVVANIETNKPGPCSNPPRQKWIAGAVKEPLDDLTRKAATLALSEADEDN